MISWKIESNDSIHQVLEKFGALSFYLNKLGHINNIYFNPKYDEKKLTRANKDELTGLIDKVAWGYKFENHFKNISSVCAILFPMGTQELCISLVNIGIRWHGRGSYEIDNSYEANDAADMYVRMGTILIQVKKIFPKTEIIDESDFMKNGDITALRKHIIEYKKRLNEIMLMTKEINN